MSPLLMIPGPVELSPGVLAALAEPPLAHTSAVLVARFGDALRAMRRIWKAPDDHQPFLLAGSGTLAMEAAVVNLLDPGATALLVETGYFGARMAEMLARRGVAVERVVADPGDAPGPEAVVAALGRGRFAALFATHVDTSTGVRVDARSYAAAAAAAGVPFVLDGVCATGGEPFDQRWGVDVYLTASQKALGCAPGLALMVVSPRALALRGRLATPPPLVLDWAQWLPVHRAYEEGRGSYFATPATGLVRALAQALEELGDPDAAVARQAAAGAAMRRAWEALGLALVPRPGLAADTLSALWLPEGVDATFPAKVGAHGVTVAGGLHPAIRTRYFRVGHMGWVTTRPDLLARTARAVGLALRDAGHPCDPEDAVRATLP